MATLMPIAAQGLMSSFQSRPLGTFGQLAALSFHETKNVHCGEGGGLLVNDDRYVERAEIVLEKGTNRRNFLRGQVDKYTWVDIGSSFVLSEINAAFLWAQLQEAQAMLRDALTPELMAQMKKLDEATQSLNKEQAQ